jgi:hypothetical protein
MGGAVFVNEVEARLNRRVNHFGRGQRKKVEK